MAVALADIHVKVDPEIKAQSEDVLGRIGISMSDLVNMTLRRVVYEKQIPFETRLPEAELPECMKIDTKEDFLEFIDEALEKSERSPETYTISEARKQLEVEMAGVPA